MIEYKIIRKGNYGHISPEPNIKLNNMLDKQMCYQRQGAEFMPHIEWSWVHLYSKKTFRFPWGFRKLVKKILDKWEDYSGETFEFEKEEIINCNVEIPDILRDYQIDAIMKLIENSGGILCMPTGSGKTITAIKYIEIMNLPTVIITTTLDIKKMWEEKTKDMQNVHVINYQNKNAKYYVSISSLIIMDECHHAAAKTIYNLGMGANSETILVGLSATPRREDGEDMRVTGSLGEIVYSISRRELIEQGFLSDAVVYYFKPIFDSQQDFTNTYAEIYKKHIVENFDRNTSIIETASKYALAGKKVLVLVSQIDHGQYLYNSIACRSKLFCHGSTKDRYKKLEDYDVIVASNIFNEGIDLPSLDVVILAAGGKSSIMLTQRIGRVLRPSINKDKAIVIDFVDTPRYLDKHYKRRRAILEEDFEVKEV